MKQLKPGQRYTRDLLIVSVVYTVTTILALGFARQLEMTNPLRYVLALLPMIPIGGGIAVYARFLREIDELQRRIQLEAISFSVCGTGLITYGLGFLESVGMPSVGLIWVFPLSIVLWGVGLHFARRKYQ